MTPAPVIGLAATWRTAKMPTTWASFTWLCIAATLHVVFPAHRLSACSLRVATDQFSWQLDGAAMLAAALATT